MSYPLQTAFRKSSGQIAAAPSFIVFIALALALSACSFSLAEDVTPPPGYQPPPPRPQEPVEAFAPSLPGQAPDPAQGAAIYVESCAPCHGPTGLGDGAQAAQLPNPVPPLGDPELARVVEPLDWFTMVSQGNLENFMPPFSGSLTESQRWDVLAFVFSLSAPESAITEGETLYQASCANCHGSAGQGDGPEAVNLSTAPPDFSDPAYMAGRSLTEIYEAISLGQAPTMPAYEAELDQSARWVLTHYVQSLSFSQPDEAVAEVDTELVDAEEPAESPAEGNPVAEAPEAAAAQHGIVTGQVINGSGGEVPGALEVTLHAFDHIQEIFTDTVKIAEDGTYRFENVEMPEDRIFMVTVDYSEATYNSDLGIVEAEVDAIDLPLFIFDTTTDSSLLAVDRLHIFIEPAEAGMIQVTELYLITNPSDRVVVAAEAGQPVVRYTLPEGATNLQFQTGSAESRFVQTDDGFGDTVGVPPGSGQYQVMYAYNMPYDRKLEFEKPHNLPVNAVTILMPDMGLRVRSDQLVDTGPRDIQGETFFVYTGNRLEAGQALSVSLSGQVRTPGLPSDGPMTSNSLVIGLAALGVALVGSGVWLFRRNQVSVAASGAGYSAPEVVGNGTQEGVIDAIIALDDLYKAGDLPEAAYRKRRAELKDKLRAMVSEAPSNDD
jgi:mono/diheme cytochrome c family protein